MTSSDGSESMDAVRKLSDGEIDDLFAGRAPEGSGLDGLATALVSMRASQEATASDVAGRHIAAAAEVAALRSRSVAATPTPEPNRRRRAAAGFGAVLATTFGKVATGVAAASIAAGIAGAAGVLPDPAQSILSDVSGVFPEPDDHRDDDPVEVDGCAEAGSACAEGSGGWPDRSHGFGRSDRPSAGPSTTIAPAFGVDDPLPRPDVDPEDDGADLGDPVTETPSDDAADVDGGPEADDGSVDEPTDEPADEGPDVADTPTDQEAGGGFEDQDVTSEPTEGEADGTTADDAADASEPRAADEPEPAADAGLADG